MPKYMAVHVVVLAGLVAAVTLLIFQSRALTFRVQALESSKAQDAPASSPTPFEKSAPLEELKPTYYEGNPKYGLRQVPPPGAAVPAQAEKHETLTPAQEQAVAQAVDRILKEKYGHLPKFGKPEDLEKVLAKELNLTESQKARIAEILKRKREELRALFEGKDPMAGSTLQKGLEIEKRYDSAIRNELDAAQQAKYDQLKKEGKIPAGLSVQIEAGDGSRKEDIEVK